MLMQKLSMSMYFCTNFGVNLREELIRAWLEYFIKNARTWNALVYSITVSTEREKTSFFWRRMMSEYLLHVKIHPHVTNVTQRMMMELGA